MNSKWHNVQRALAADSAIATQNTPILHIGIYMKADIFISYRFWDYRALKKKLYIKSMQWLCASLFIVQKDVQSALGNGSSRFFYIYDRVKSMIFKGRD